MNNTISLGENQKYEIARSVSKCGELCLVSDETINEAKRLDDSSKIELYIYIKDESMRLEAEWRNEFCHKIEISHELLPEAESETDIIMQFLEAAKESQSKEEVADEFEDLLYALQDFDRDAIMSKIKENEQEYLLPVLDNIEL